MRASSPLSRVVVAYGVLWALLDLVVLLPGGNASFSSSWGLVGSVLIQSLLVWRLARGSALAWGFGLLMALGTIASLFLMGAPFGVTETFLLVVCLAQASVLLTPTLLGQVWSQRQPPPASA